MTRLALYALISGVKYEYAEAINCAGRAFTALLRLSLKVAMVVLLAIAALLGVLDDQVAEKQIALQAKEGFTSYGR